MITLENNQPTSSDNSNELPSATSNPMKTTPSYQDKSVKNSTKKMPVKMMVGIIILVLTIVGGIAGYLLTQTSQDVRQQAADGVDPYAAGNPCSTEGATQCDADNNKVTCAGSQWRASGSCDDGPGDTTKVSRFVKITESNGNSACQEVQLAISDPGYQGSYASIAACEASFGYCCVQGITTAGLTAGECTGAKGTIGKCSNAPNDQCNVGDEECRSNALYSCKASTSGNFFSNTGQSCQAACTGEADCVGASLFCNLTSGQCEPLSTAVGNDCNPGDTLSGGNPGQACCVGGENECKSGACSGPSGGTIEGKIGTCLGGVGGPSTGPTQDSCIAQGFDFRCGDCGGFCGKYSDGKTCKQLAYEQLADGQCAEGVQNGGSCAIGGYNAQYNICTQYCTNILGKNGDDCGVDRPAGTTCEYVGPENPDYATKCPNGNGVTDFGWDGQCFNQVPAGYQANTYYCECPNGDCTGVSLGQGCQKGAQSGTCFQGGTCGVLQVDLDNANPPANMSSHTSRNKMVTSGCSVQPQPPTTPPTDIIVNPPTTTTTYSCNSTCSTDAQCRTIGSNYECNEAAGNRCRLTNNPGSAQCQPPTKTYSCNSTCTTDAQCQTADDDFICSEAEGNRCRLDSNVTSATCQPAAGPMCLSISLSNISNPTAAATADPKLGDAVNFTCGLVSGADHYIFRVIEPDNNIVNLSATGATSQQYTISKSGLFQAQCQICTGAAEDTCHSYEPYTITD